MAADVVGTRLNRPAVASLEARVGDVDGTGSRVRRDLFEALRRKPPRRSRKSIASAGARVHLPVDQPIARQAELL